VVLRRLFQRGRGDEEPSVGGHPPRLPEGCRVYAIGDVHGCLDLLLRLEQAVAEDAATTGAHLAHYLVYLGDYVDRGWQSRGVVEHLAQPRHDGLIRVHLAGNHDIWLRDYLRGLPIAPGWLRYGGDATLVSYGVRLAPGDDEEERLLATRDALVAVVPESHLAFLDRLEIAFSFGDYFFCHAGVRPNLPLAAQSDEDLIWIREPFLDWRGDPGKVIVHGHTIDERPTLRRNRIGIDTGAYSTGNLTCLVLEGRQRRFISTLPEEEDEEA
jgi:serine/threonine protein phosphatase 1